MTARAAERSAAEPLARYLAGALSPPVTMMALLVAHRSVASVERAIEKRLRERSAVHDGRASPARERLLALRQLLRDNRSGCERIARMLRELDGGAHTPDASAENSIAACRRLFDRAVRHSEEGSVALYSLGNPELLAAATREIVDLLCAWGVIGAERDVLQIGCGIGRFEVALAPLVRQAWGIDISANMIERARLHCRHLGNVHLAECSGRDLAPFDARRFDLVYAVDSFPYIVQSGAALVERHFADVARVLRPGGDFVVLNYSYRGDAQRDRREVRQLAGAFGFDVVVDGASPFTLWDGLAFHLRSGAASRTAR